MIKGLVQRLVDEISVSVENALEAFAFPNRVAWCWKLPPPLIVPSPQASTPDPIVTSSTCCFSSRCLIMAISTIIPTTTPKDYLNLLASLSDSSRHRISSTFTACTCHPSVTISMFSFCSPFYSQQGVIIPGPLTFRIMLRLVSSMNSTLTCVTPPREPADRTHRSAPMPR